MSTLGAHSDAGGDTDTGVRAAGVLRDVDVNTPTAPAGEKSKGGGGRKRGRPRKKTPPLNIAQQKQKREEENRNVRVAEEEATLLRAAKRDDDARDCAFAIFQSTASRYLHTQNLLVGVSQRARPLDQEGARQLDRVWRLRQERLWRQHKRRLRSSMDTVGGQAKRAVLLEMLPDTACPDYMYNTLCASALFLPLQSVKAHWSKWKEAREALVREAWAKKRSPSSRICLKWYFHTGI